MIINENNNDIIEIKNINKTKIFNYGLALLKSLLSFLVIISHCFKSATTKNKFILYVTSNRIIHVPSFFMMSFYFMCNNLLSLNNKKLYERFIRLLIPYIIWPVIIWIIYNIFNIKYENRFPDSFEILKLQILWGSRFMHQFWFQWNLIIITILFIIIIFIFRSISLLIFHILLILSYIAQYSGYCYKNIFLKLQLYNRYIITRIFEMLPLAITGYTLGLYKVIYMLQKFRKRAIFFSFLIYKTLSNYRIFTNVIGLNFYGINLNVQSISVIFIFSLIPFNQIKKRSIIKILLFLTNYSGGIFYLHVSIYEFCKFYLVDIRKGSFFGMIINYFICYFICFLGSNFFENRFIKYLFN